MQRPASKPVNVIKASPKVFAGAVALAGFPVPAADTELPKRFIVLPWGEHDTRFGKIICNATTIANLEKNQILGKRITIALDFQHNSAPSIGADGKMIPVKEPIDVAGYGKLEAVAGEGVWMVMEYYTPEGDQKAKGGHYPCLSPYVFYNDDREVIFIDSVALCRQGEINNLRLPQPGGVALSGEILSGLQGLTPTKPQPTNKAMLTREQSIELLRKMGVEISDSCTEEELNTAIATALAKGGDVTPAPAATKIEGEGAGCSAAMTKALTDAVAAAMAPLSAKLGAIEAKNVSDEKAALINKATQAGKAVTLSADIIAGMSPAALSAVLDQLPAGQVPLEGATRTNPGAAAQGAALSAEDASTVHKLFPGLKALDAKKLGELAELA